MATISIVLLGVGALCVILNMVLGIIELATLRLIRPAKLKTFAHIRLSASQYQTIIGPAVGALISGLFVSLSASFFYGALTGGQGAWHQQAGAMILITGMVALVITLHLFLKDFGEPAELARDPSTIRAAADESAANPRGGSLDPDFLTHQLNQWSEYISACSMNLSVKKKSELLDRSLERAAEAHGFWSLVARSFNVYWAAFLAFPTRFMWPLIGFGLFALGTISIAVGDAGLDFTSSARPWIVLILLLTTGAAITVFYCAARGNRARLWYQVNLIGLKDAENAIDAAKAAKVSVEVEDAVLKRVLIRADTFLQQTGTSPDSEPRFLFHFGRIRVSIFPTPVSEHRS